MKILFKKLVWLTAVIAVSVLFTGCQGGPPAMGGLPVNVEVLKPVEVVHSSRYLAYLDSDQAVNLMPRVSGQVAKILVQEGQFVTKGQPLILLDADELGAAVEAQRQQVAASEQDVEQAAGILKASLSLKQSSVSNNAQKLIEKERLEKLLPLGGASKQDVERAQDALNKSQADLGINDNQISAQAAAVKAAQKRLAQSKANLKQQQAVLGYYTVKAPFNGQVGNIPVRVGSVVDTNTLMCSVSDSKVLELNLSVETDKAAMLKKGLPVYVEDNQGQVLHKGQLSFVSPVVDVATQTILVKATLTNPNGTSRPWQVGKVRIDWDRSPGLTLPPTAITHMAGQDFVFVVVSDKAGKHVAQRPAKLGSIQHNRYVVVDGLKPNEMVVVEGVQKLQDKAPITIIPNKNQIPMN